MPINNLTRSRALAIIGNGNKAMDEQQRAANGQFGSGGGSSGNKSYNEVKQDPEHHVSKSEHEKQQHYADKYVALKRQGKSHSEAIGQVANEAREGNNGISHAQHVKNVKEAVNNLV